jgi:uncharacterized protein YqgQ
MNYAVIVYLNSQQVQFLYNIEKFYNRYIFNSLYLETNTILSRERRALSKKAGDMLEKIENRSPYAICMAYRFLFLTPNMKKHLLSVS